MKRKPAIEKAKPKNRPKSLKRNETVIIRWELVDDLIKRDFNAKEIASKLKLSYSTLQRRFKDEFNDLLGSYIREFPDKVASEWQEPGKNGKNIFDEIEMMSQAGCLGTEIAAYLGVGEEFFYKVCHAFYSRNFKDVRLEYKTKGNAMLKTKQFSLAMKGDKQMLTILGKDRLQQSENINVNVKARVLTPEEIKEHFNKLEDNY